MSFQYHPSGSDSVLEPPFVQRRATVRYRCPPASLGRLFIANTYTSLNAWVQNLSLQGAGLLVGRAMEPDTWVTIELENNTRDLCLELTARVVHASPQSDGNWVVGCRFNRSLTKDELEALL